MSVPTSEEALASIRQSIDQIDSRLDALSTSLDAQPATLKNLLERVRQLAELVVRLSDRLVPHIENAESQAKGWWWKAAVSAGFGALLKMLFDWLFGTQQAKAPEANGAMTILNALKSLGEPAYSAIIVIAVVVVAVLAFGAFHLAFGWLGSIFRPKKDPATQRKDKGRVPSAQVGAIKTPGQTADGYFEMVVARLRENGHGDIVDAVIKDSR